MGGKDWGGNWVLAGPRSVQFISVQLLSCVWLFATSWTAACRASLSITNFHSLLKLMSIESVMPSNHLSLCCPLLLLPSIFPSIRVFSNESALRIRWPMYGNFSFSISPSSEHSGLISFRMDWLDILALQGTLESSQITTVQKHQFLSTQLPGHLQTKESGLEKILLLQPSEGINSAETLMLDF